MFLIFVVVVGVVVGVGCDECYDCNYDASLEVQVVDRLNIMNQSNYPHIDYHLYYHYLHYQYCMYLWLPFLALNGFVRFQPKLHKYWFVQDYQYLLTFHYHY